MQASVSLSPPKEILIWVQPVWLQLSRDRKSLKSRENVQVRGIETGPVARLEEALFAVGG